MLLENLEFSTNKKYHKFVGDWNNTGDCYCIDSNTVVGLEHDMEFTRAIQEIALQREEITEDEVAFSDDNAAVYNDLSSNISDESLDEYYESIGTTYEFG